MPFKFSSQSAAAAIRCRTTAVVGLRKGIPFPRLPKSPTPHLRAFFALLALPLVVGCQSDSHRVFSSPPGQTNPKPPSKSGRGDERVLFNSVYATNQIRQEWLAAPTNFFRLGPGDGI